MRRCIGKLLIAAALALSAAALCGVCCAEEEGVRLVKNGADIFFYVLVALLTLAVIVICVVFSRSEKFVIRKRERMAEQNKEVPPPDEIRIVDAEDLQD